MKKVLLLLLILFLAACGSEEPVEETESGKENETAETTQEESKYPFPTDSTEMGEGSINVSTGSGASENGNVPVLFVGKDALLTQISLILENFDGDKETFIYIDEYFIEAEQVGFKTKTSLSLEGNLLKPGTYTVTAVQFENNDPNSTPVAFTEAQYEIKEATE